MQKKYGEFATIFFSDLYVAVCSISSDLSKKHYGVDARKVEYDSPIIDVMFAEYEPFHQRNIKVAKCIYKVVQSHDSKNEQFKSEIKSLMNDNKLYYSQVRSTMKSNITNMFKDSKYSSAKAKAPSKDSIQKIMNNPSTIPEQLFSLFKSYLRRSYTALSKNNIVTLVDVAAITASAIYTLLDIASVVCSYKMLNDGIRIAVDRSKIEPANSWFQSK